MHALVTESRVHAQPALGPCITKTNNVQSYKLQRPDRLPTLGATGLGAGTAGSGAGAGATTAGAGAARGVGAASSEPRLLTKSDMPAVYNQEGRAHMR